MVVSKTKPVTLEDFETWVALPENSGRLFELIEGEMVEVSPGRTRNSEIAHRFVRAIGRFCDDHQIPCHTSGEAGAYRIGNNVVAPDFAYKSTRMSSEYPDPVPPQLAVEIISPTDKADDIRKKRGIYRRANILLWEVYPSTESVDVYAPGQPVAEFGLQDVLDGGPVLPGFSLDVAYIFAED